MKKTLAVILILAIILSFCSCSVIQRKYPPAKDNGNIDMNTWSESIERAESLENSVISKYSNADRDEYFIKNKTFELKHKLGSDSTVSFLSDSGNVYFEDSLNLYIKDENGIYYSDNPNSAARMNTYRMGFYYTDIHMLDMQTKFNDKTVYFEKIFHTYADKLHTEYRFVSDSIVSGIDEYGTEIKIPTENVNAVYFTDSSGEHNDLSDLKENTAVSFALDVKDTGVIGFILSDGENIYVNEENGFYAVRHYKKAENSDIIRGEPLSLSCRLYNDKSHSFEGFKQAIAEEKTFPDISIFKQVDGARILGYNSKNGAYEIRMDGIDFNSAYHTYPNYHFKANIEVNNNTFDRNIYIRCISYTGHLESSVLLDENELLLPISVEVNKNFNGEFEEPIYDPYDTAYGEAVFPLQIKNDETRKFTLVQLYQNWGNYPLKQFSSIQFIAPYYHQSCGVTETNCISPYYIFGKDGWILPDFRAMSATMWPSQPQHYTYGRLYAASLTDPDNPNNLFPEFQKTDILNSGPAYIDAYTYYSFENNGVDVKYRHAEHPQTDENRTMYSMVISFSKDLSVEDAKINFALFSTDGRITNYKNIGYLNENNQTSYETLSDNKSEYRFIKLGNEFPYFSMFTSKEATDVSNLGFIVKNFEAVIGGQRYNGNLMLGVQDSTSTLRLVLDMENIQFQEGDYINMDYILLPFGDHDIENDNSVKTVREDMCIKPIIIEPALGITDSEYPIPTITAQEDEYGDMRAVFTLSQGRSTNTVSVKGFKTPNPISIYERVDGKWQEYKLNSKSHKYDGYSVNKCSDGTYEFSFVIDMGKTGLNTREFTAVGK